MLRPMDKKQKILELRQRLDKSLSSPGLMNEESIKSLVRDQLLCSSFSGNRGDLENVVTRRTKEVSNFLEMLRSASGDKIDTLKAHGEQSDWKIKQDTEQLRVLYHEGPQGSPFHTLLAEGCADGPIDACLSVSWESTLYQKWWPAYTIPTFKITMSNCLQKVRVGEQISLIRVKVPWPVSDREALVHYLDINYFEEDLILILLNTVSDTEHVDESSHGFTRDGIPEAKDTVRVNLVGGFVLQKVDANSTYFRTIANMDIKLDFVPPSLINFMSRQLIGSGFKLYQKAVGSVAKADNGYFEALKGPMYVRIREGLDSRNRHKIASAFLEDEQHIHASTEHLTVETAVENPPATPNTSVTEIVELEAENSPERSSTNSIVDQNKIILKRHFISPEVEQALGILDRAIATVRSPGFSNICSDCPPIDQESPTVDSVAQTGHLSDEAPPKSNNMDKQSEDDQSQPSAGVFRLHDDNSQSKVSLQASVNTEEVSSTPAIGKLTGDAVLPIQPAFLDRSRVCDEQSLQVSGFTEKGETNKPNSKKKHRICCMRLSFFGG